LDLFPNQRLQVMFAALCHDLSPNLPAALHESDYDGLIIINAARERPCDLCACSALCRR
jgi:hypothetical protein